MQTIDDIIRGGNRQPPKARTSKLGWLQRDILEHVAKSACRNNGVAPWRHEGEWTQSDLASESRALRQLEERGLVVRLNLGGTGRRTTHVELTEAGWQLIGEILRGREVVNTEPS